jgi:hypothetical protein
MNNNRQTRTFADAMGRAVAFGIGVTTCDIFTLPASSGYTHGMSQYNEEQTTMDTAFTMDTFEVWRKMMHTVESLAHERGHDPCSYGVAIYRTSNVVTLQLVRYHSFMGLALDSAEEEGTENCIRDINEPDTAIYLHDHGRVPEGGVTGTDEPPVRII